MALQEVNDFAPQLVRERRASPDDADDLLSLLIREAEPPADSWLRDQVVDLLMAAHDSVALTLARTWILLADHPAVESRLADEAAHATDPPTFAQLARLTSLEMVTREALRLYPPGRGLLRETVVDTEIGGHRLPRGTMVLLSQWVTQRDPGYFESPEAFLPERWANGLADRLLPFAYFPFGGGPRRCIGATFATATVQLVLATIAQHWRLAPARPPAWDPVFLRPTHGVWMVPLHRDRPAARSRPI